MGYRLTNGKMDEILSALQAHYHIFGPRINGRDKKVRYSMIDSVSQIVTDRQSDFSPKEIYYPVSQMMYSFRDGKVYSSEEPDGKGILIFARACDINAVRRLDEIFLRNGGSSDVFYERMRRKVRFILMECSEGFEHCFCASVGSNQTEDYSLAVCLKVGELLVQVKDDEFSDLFSSEEPVDYSVTFVERNRRSLRAPQINKSNLKAVSGLDYWLQFDERCIACGGCNTVCGTCSCFDITDIVYSQGARDGERRRIWSSCMLKDFTRTAGGGLSRKTQGANMRFKVFHKFYDYRVRMKAGEDMCVGCGRCDLRCPANISFFDTVCHLHDVIESLEV